MQNSRRVITRRAVAYRRVGLRLDLRACPARLVRSTRDQGENVVTDEKIRTFRLEIMLPVAA